MRLASLLALALLVVAFGLSVARRRAADPAAQTAGGRVEMVDPRELLFSLPTINDGLPPLEGPNEPRPRE